MSAPSSSKLDELQEQLAKFSRLAANELSKGADCNESRVALFQKQVDILIAHTKLIASGESGRSRPRAVERYNTAAPLYSAWVAEKLNMPEIYKQYGLYGSSLFGVSVLTNRLFRARALAKYAEAKIAHAPESQLLYWTHMANVEPWRLERPARHIVHLRAQGMLAAVGAPLFWVCWVLSPDKRVHKNR